MLHRIFRLTDIKYIETITEDLEYGQDIVIVRPTYLSICAADQRYFFGKRKKAIMQKKLPLALIHEAVGQYLQTIISNECDVRSVDDIYNAFELDKLGDFKTVIHWNV
ncbi:MAG: hypothetical protein PUF95_00165 [Selenomonadaceae bacterium]|nr:hypothetical protein [Selenomonadaceae bacterium]